MNKVYTRINWENEPSANTPLNRDNLDKMDSAINEIDNRVISQDTIKADKTTVNNLIADWHIDETTGVITITRLNGEQIIFDLNLEKIPTKFTLSEDGILTMITDDGSEFKANIGAMIPILTFESSEEIAVSVSGSGVNKTYSFSIKTGSVTADKLQPNFLADVKTEVNKAELASTNASTYATNAYDYSLYSKSYAVGDSGIRDGEDTDNAKYYKEETEKMYSDFTKSQVIGVKGNAETEYRTGNVNITAENVGAVQHIDLSGKLQNGNYRSVIALCRTTLANISVDSFSAGTITFYRNTGWSNSTSRVDFTISGDYSYANYITAALVEYGKTAGVAIKPCTFTYNGETYGGLEVYINSASSNNIFFDGTTNFGIFGVDYYDVANSAVLNEEINNSINYTKIRYLPTAYYNCNPLAYANGSNASGTWGINISGNAATATKANNATNATYDDGGNEIATSYTKRGIVLWQTSGSVGSGEFTGDITLDESTSNYNYYEIEYCLSNSNTSNYAVRFKTGKLPKASKTKLITALDYNYVRDVLAPSDTTITFGDCVKYLTYGANATTETVNKYLVPIRVIGYKTL